MTTVGKIVTETKSKKASRAKNHLIKFVSKINAELEEYFNRNLKNTFGVSKSEKALTKHILSHIKEHNLRPAKRLRGSFVHAGYRLFKNDKEKDLVKAATSVELIHTALLMHDDFMDQDDTRRGLPTTHEYFKKYHRKHKFRFDSHHFGESMAVNTGDVALMMGFRILGESNFPVTAKLSAINRILKGIENTAYGQSYDMMLENKGAASQKDIINLHNAKTAIYTYENPLYIGAILAGAKKSDLEIISQYAIPGGIAFQLQDDILGLFGDTKKTGKPAYSDLRQGKMTLLIIKAFETANKKQKIKIAQIWGNKNLTTSKAQEVRKIVVETGSLEYSKQTAIKWAKKAQKAIPKMIRKGWNPKAIQYLDGIAQYMVERDL